MALPKAQEKETEYDIWAGEVAIDGYNDGKYGRSFVGEIDGEKTWFNQGKQLKKLGIELAKGNIYSIKMSRKVGTKGWYVTEATLISGDTPPAEKPNTKKTMTPVGISDKMSKTDWEKKDNLKAEGQARGNYRTGLMAFICTHYSLTKELPKPEVIDDYNACIKHGEKDFEKETAPADAKGLIE